MHMLYCLSPYTITRLQKNPLSIEHLHDELVRASSSCVPAAIRKKADEKSALTRLSDDEKKLEEVVDATGGPIRRLRHQKVCRLQTTIRVLSEYDCDPDSCGSDINSSAASHQMIYPLLNPLLMMILFRLYIHEEAP